MREWVPLQSVMFLCLEKLRLEGSQKGSKMRSGAQEIEAITHGEVGGGKNHV